VSRYKANCWLPGLLTLVLAGWPVLVSAGDVVARLDRNELVEGETVTLILQTDDPQQSLEADFGRLEKDFQLLDRRSETQMSIVGGRQTAVIRLLLTLEPLRSGTLQVPALEFPGARTGPLTLQVSPAPEPAPGEMPPVFIEVSLEPIEGPYYVHAQLSLTVKIFYQQNLTEASINPPAPEQASVRLLDEVPFPAERNGTQYRVLQRRYAIFPERSGTLEIPPMRLTGRLIERPSERLWQPSVRGRRISEESEPLMVDIQPRPAGYQAQHWLPARALSLEQQISGGDGVRVGEPVTRTILVDAVGLEENMLEEPHWPDLKDARIYPDQPQGISRDDGQWVQGHKEFRYAVVPEQAGTLVLPEIRLEWWDVVANQSRVAVLPEQRIEVAPLDLAPAVSLPPAAIPGVSAGAEQVHTAAPGDGLWRLLAVIFASLWLVTTWFWWRGGRQWTRQPLQESLPGDEHGVLEELRKACRAGDVQRTRSLWRRWLRRHGARAAHGSILQFARTAGSAELREALLHFETAGYQAGVGRDWNGEALWRALDGWRAQQGARVADSAATLPDLYAPGR